MNGTLVQQTMAWAEDRATVGTDPSADPGAKTERRAVRLGRIACLSSFPFGIGTKAINPSRRSREPLTVKNPADGLPEVRNSERQKLHFTLNHYRSALEYNDASREAASASRITIFKGGNYEAYSKNSLDLEDSRPGAGPGWIERPGICDDLWNRSEP